MTNPQVEVLTAAALKIYWSHFLVGAGVDVLAVSSILHQCQVIISGECEVGHAANQASNVLSVCVKSYLFHATFFFGGGG